MRGYVRITTSPEVYHVIFARHGDQLSVFESFSDPDGTFNGGPGERGRMETAWGFKGCEWPLLRCQTTWDINPEQPYKRINQESNYWLCLPSAD